jgi:hypothetical protein
MQLYHYNLDDLASRADFAKILKDFLCKAKSGPNACFSLTCTYIHRYIYRRYLEVFAWNLAQPKTIKLSSRMLSRDPQLGVSLQAIPSILAIRADLSVQRQ